MKGDTNQSVQLRKFGQLPHENGKTSTTDIAINSNGDSAGYAKTPGFPETEERLSDKEKKKKADKAPAVGLCQLFRYATKLDVVLMLIGVLGSICHGVAFPLQFIFLGDLINSFINYSREQTANNGTSTLDLESELTTFALYYVYLAVATIVISYLQMGLWAWTGARQTREMRLVLFRSILKQDVGWFDATSTGELNNRLTEDLEKVGEGIGQKIGLFIQSITTFVTGFLLGFVFSWKLTLVMLAMTPLLMIAGGIIGVLVGSLSAREHDAYAKAGSIAEEVISAIRTVVAFGGEEKESDRYSSHLQEAQDIGVRKSLIYGLGLGFFQFVMFGSYALAFWYGSKLIIDAEITGGDLVTVFFAVMGGAMQLGQAAPQFEAIAEARGAAYQVFKVIDRVPPFDSSSTEGEQPEAMAGDIELRDVNFSYPSRTEVKILNGLNLSVGSGQTVALVGESGCGKSTVVKLIQRFYDPNEGQVTIDGKTIPSLNIKWLRQHIGVVSQEPVLFATTIAENIRYGKEDVTQEEIEEACRMANAHDFISQLPEKYETPVGERGTQLSGGQKQRIAIARALVKDPKILLLDEATSALDTESEAIVQAALDKARLGRTTIIIAHRLSTIRNADVIAVLDRGRVVAMGTHHELMQMEGLYKHLVTLQTFKEKKDDEAEDDFDSDEEIKKILESRPRPRRRFSRRRRSSGLSSVDGFARRLSRQLTRMSVASVLFPSVETETLDDEDIEPASFWRILKLNRTEWPYFVWGSLGALFNGLFPMVLALLLGEVLQTFTQTDFEEMKRTSTFWSLMFIGLGVGTCITQIVQHYMFGKSGEILTMRLRKMTFESILRQEITFFDENSTGALTTTLATHASAVKGATGWRLGTIVLSLSTVVACLVFALYSSWKLALLVVAFLPFIVAGSTLQMKALTSGAGNEDELLEFGAISAEAIDNIRTVVSLGIEENFYKKFVGSLVLFQKRTIRQAQLLGVTSGFAEATVFFCNAAAFRLGAYLVVKGEIELDAVVKVVYSIVIGARFLGQISAVAPDYLKAREAAARLFKLFDQKSPIDYSADWGTVPESVEGKIQLRSARFRYPTRLNVKVLRGLTLSIKSGQKVALVGASGCGKSTVIALMERFYDVREGELSLDGSDVRSLNIKWLRAQMGLVSQEPVLFGCSIAENIAYGDNSRAVSMTEIEAAAQAANVHSFINSLPKGYDTLVGAKGALISGGQKQRIAIARALIRNPPILLLDEATSALDTDSEKIVQEALDAASKGRTTVVIAHRLSTVQNADAIAVIKHGRVVELGTHQDLLEQGGHYHGLVMAQIMAAKDG